MLPKELDDIFEEHTPDDYSLYVTKADDSGDNLLIGFVLDIQGINDKDTITQIWTIDVIGHRKNHLSFDFAPFIEIRDDHPLLWEFTDTQCELYFTGQCKDIAKLFYDLYWTHKNLFGNFQCFNIPHLKETSYFKPLQYSNGLLTKGSKKLMEMYASCLQQNGLDFTLFGERPANYWDGQQYVTEQQDLKILFMGNTYIIAKNFSFVRQE